VALDRRSGDGDAGYGLALWPHGTRIFHALGIHDEFVERSETMGRYAARSETGALLTRSPMPESIRSYGHLGLICRSDLFDLLHVPR
jgi:hypothetical protein